MAVEGAERPGSNKIGILLWGVILLIAACAVGAVIFVQRYAPLVPGSLSGISGSTKQIETYDDTPVQLLTPWDEGSTFFAGMTLRNDGPIGVKVTGILMPHELGHDGEPGNGFEPIAVVLAPRERFVGDLTLEFDDYGDFAPFELGPGDERRIAIEYQLNECNPRNQSMSDDSISVRFSLWGMDRDTQVDLPYRLVADGRYREGC